VQRQAKVLKSPPLTDAIPTVIGRYEIVSMLGRGGMATVYLARSAGEAGFSRLFAIKVLHPHLADNASFVNMLLEEGQIAARLHHPNVVPIIDVGSHGHLRYVVLEYVDGCALSVLLSKSRDVRPPRLIVPIVLDALNGLHAAHTLTYDDGRPMKLVHRDVTPQNILVGVEGAARISDFGIAKAQAGVDTTSPGQIKGKLAFMSPEQLRGGEIDRRSDLFSAGCLLWSALTGRRLFLGPNDAETITNLLSLEISPPSTVGLKPPPIFDQICMRALERDRNMRWSSAAEMEDALREAAQKHGLLGSRREVGDWVTGAFGEELKARRAVVHEAASRHPSGNMDSGGTRKGAASGLRLSSRMGQPEVDLVDVDVDVELPTPTPGNRSVTVGPVPVQPPVRQVRLVSAALGAILVGALGLWFLVRSPARPSGHSAEPLAPPPIAAVPLPAASSTASVPAEQNAPDPVSAASAPAVSAPTLGTNETTTPQPKGGWGKKPQTPASPGGFSPSQRACRTVSYFDNDGNKHFKQQCP
jgi:eukaryotic-like serine/threonine-protein kinase